MIMYRAKSGVGLIIIVVLACVICFCGTDTFAQLDETWTVTVNGQTVQVNPDGSFKIPNISAADQFGTGGPGTRPDFLSDDFLRVIGVSTAGGVPRWAFSEPFQISSGETFFIGNMTITETPPPFPDALRMTVDDPTLTAIDQTTQLHVTGVLADGGEIDVTPRSAWTIYRTSNPSIATVGENGLVTAKGAGVAFITAVNEGATAVKRITVVPGDPLTTLEGFVQLEDGTPVNGAELIVQPVGVIDITDTDGFFQIPDIPTELGALSVRATISISGERFVGAKVITTFVKGGVTDAGIIVIKEGGIPINITFDAGFGDPPSYIEAGMTVTSLQTHLHFTDGGALRNHARCCSTPYEFTFGGAPFTVVSLDVVAHVSGTHTFASSSGAVETVAGVGTHTFPSAGWQDITSFQWNATGEMFIDNLVIEAQPVVE